MTAREIISDSIMSVRTSDTGEQVLTMMNIYHVKHLPVVNANQLLGVISEEDVLTHDLDAAVGSYELSLSKPFCNHKEHLFEVLKTIADSKLTVLPVVDDDGNYMGIITQKDVLSKYAESFSFTEPGCILVLETTKQNYSLSEISRIVEEESAAILTSFLTSPEDSTRIMVTLKINKNDISRIIQSFERYDYQVKATYSEEEFIDGLKERYDSLMSYLNV